MGSKKEEDDFAKILAESEWNPDKVEASGPKPMKKINQPQMSVVDLHGLTLDEAVVVVDRAIAGLLVMKAGSKKLRIITGKGRHSPGGSGLLVTEVYRHVVARWSAALKTIDSPPDRDLINGLPVRGHFDVEF